MTTMRICKAILVFTIMSTTSVALAQTSPTALSVITREKIPYYADPGTTQLLGQFPIGTNICMRNIIANQNGRKSIQFFMPPHNLVYTPLVNFAAIPRWPASDQDCARIALMMAPLINQLASQAPSQQPPPAVATQTAPQQPTVAAAPRPTVSRQDAAKYLAYLEKTVKHDAEGWVMNKYVLGSMTDLRAFYDKDNGSLTGLEAHYTFTDSICDPERDFQHCKQSGWVAIKLDSKVPCLVYWDNKDTCRPVTEHDPAYKFVQAYAAAHSQPATTHNTTPDFVGGMIKENMWRCGGIGYGLSGC